METSIIICINIYLREQEIGKRKAEGAAERICCMEEDSDDKRSVSFRWEHALFGFICNSQKLQGLGNSNFTMEFG